MVMGRTRTQPGPVCSIVSDLISAVLPKRPYLCSLPLPGLHTIPAEGLALQPPPGASVLGGQFIKHFLIIIQAEDGPHTRGWLLAAHAESYQGGKRHSSPTLSIHLPCLLLLQKLFSSWSLLSDFLFTAEDHRPWSVSERECDLSCPTYSGRIAGWPGGASTSVEIAHLYLKLPRPSPSTSLHEEVSEDCMCGCPIPCLWKVKLGVKQRWPRPIFGKLHLVVSRPFPPFGWYQRVFSLF